MGGQEDNVSVIAEKDASIVLPVESKSELERKVYIDSFFYAPVKKGQNVGRIDYIVDTKVVSSVNITAVDTVEAKKNNNIFNKIKELFSNG